jgi:hypothetical protein
MMKAGHNAKTSTAHPRPQSRTAKTPEVNNSGMEDDILGEKKRMADNSKTRGQRRKNNNNDAPQVVQPGPVRVPGINASQGVSTSSLISYDQSEENSNDKEDQPDGGLQTAILIDEEVQLGEYEKKKIELQARADAEARILANAVPAEQADVDAEHEERKKRQRCRLVIAVLFVVVGVVGVVVGAALGVQNQATGPTDAPSVASTQSPTVKPGLFTPPPGTVARPDNTVCEGAYDISSVVGYSLFGEITSAASAASVDTCEVIRENGIGVWYRVEGDGSTTLVASTCEGTSFDSQISIYSGSCGKLQCIAGNDQMDLCGLNGDQSRVAFYTESKTKYYIYVHGRRSASGLFNLTVEPLLDTNDECDGAVQLNIDVPVFGSTRGATIDNNVTCDKSLPSGPGVWYSIVGNGEYFRVGLVRDGNTEFSGDIFVFQGHGCEALKCMYVGYASWDSILDEEYFILVYGNGVREGDFQIVVHVGYEALPFIPSSSCEAAWFVPGDKKELGYTTGQNKAAVASCGNLVFSTAAGVWYSTVGTGRAMTVSTCDDSTNLDTQISIFRGSCDDLECVDGNDQACGDQSSVSWFSKEEEIYFVLGESFGVLTRPLLLSNFIVLTFFALL